MKRIIPFLATIYFLSIGMAAFSSNLTREFKVDQPPNLILRNIAGNIEVTPGASDRIIIHVNRDNKNIEVDMYQSGNRINIKVRYPSRNNYGNRGNVDFHIEFPTKGDKLELRSISGSIEVSGIQADMNFQTVSGNIKVHQSTGDLKLNAVSGDIKLDELGPASIDASTISGDVTYRNGNLEGGNYSFSATSGNIKVSHGPAASYQISGRTISGHIENDVGGTLRVKVGKYTNTQSISGSFNGETVWVEVHTVSGDIHIRKSKSF